MKIRLSDIMILIPLFFLLFSADPALAMKATTVNDSVACFSKESLQEMQQFIINRDRDSFDAYIKNGKCIIMKGGLDVSVIESPGMFGGMTMFIYKGIRLWTNRRSLTNYR